MIISWFKSLEDTLNWDLVLNVVFREAKIRNDVNIITELGGNDEIILNRDC